MTAAASAASPQASERELTALRAANLRLAAEVARRRRIERMLIARNRRMLDDLRLAACFQRSLLPPVPVLPHLAIAARYRPYRHVSGDLYDFFLSREGDLGVLLGDATGHGLASALLTMLVHSALDNLRRDLPTDAMLARLNALLAERPTGRSVTAVLFRIDPRGGLAVAHAGHPSLVCLPAAGGPPVTFTKGGCALGMFVDPPVAYVEERTVLAPGDTCVAVTDGVLDWRDRGGEPFGTARLLEVLAAHRDLEPEALLDAVLGALTRHGREGRADDVTLLACRYRGPG